MIAYNYIQDNYLRFIGSKSINERNQKLGLYYSLVNAYFTSKIIGVPEWGIEIKYDATTPKYVMKKVEAPKS